MTNLSNIKLEGLRETEFQSMEMQINIVKW